MKEDNALEVVLGIGYICLFLAFFVRRPKIALALCFALGPIQRSFPGVPGVHVAIADVNVTLTFIVVCLTAFGHGRKPHWGPLAPYCIMYLVVCLISSVSDFQGSNTIIAFVQMLPYLVFGVVVFASYADLESLRPAFDWLCYLGLFFSLSVIAYRTPWIYGMHKNGMGASISSITVVEIELWLACRDPARKRRLMFLLTTSIIALFITLSRGAWLAAATGFFTIMWLRRDTRSIMRAAFVLIPVVAIAWMALPAEKQEFAAGFDASRDNIHARYVFADKAWAIFKQEPILGAGLGLRKNMDALNTILMALAETGLAGLISFLLIHVALLRMAAKANEKIQTDSWTFSCLAIGTAVMMAKFAHSMVDHYWSRGCITVAWAGTGIATRAYFESQQRRRVVPAVPVALGFPVEVPPPRQRRIPPNHRTPWPKPNPGTSAQQ